MKKQIKLTEEQLREMIMGSINNVLQEGGFFGNLFNRNNNAAPQQPQSSVGDPNATWYITNMGACNQSHDTGYQLVNTKTGEQTGWMDDDRHPYPIKGTVIPNPNDPKYNSEVNYLNSRRTPAQGQSAANTGAAQPAAQPMANTGAAQPAARPVQGQQQPIRESKRVKVSESQLRGMISEAINEFLGFGGKKYPLDNVSNYLTQLAQQNGWERMYFSSQGLVLVGRDRNGYTVKRPLTNIKLPQNFKPYSSYQFSEQDYQNLLSQVQGYFQRRMQDRDDIEREQAQYKRDQAAYQKQKELNARNNVGSTPTEYGGMSNRDRQYIENIKAKNPAGNIYGLRQTENGLTDLNGGAVENW